MLKRRNYIDKMIFHINRRSISECLLKIISNDSDFSFEFSLEEELEFKENLIINLIKSLFDNINDDEVK